MLKTLLQFEPSFSKIDNSLKKKNKSKKKKKKKPYSKTFLQVNHFSSFAIKDKQMIAVLGETGSREIKLPKFKRSNKISPQDKKVISNSKYLL